jgi:DNA-directed RNA polymerase specialized sigma24 family protein
MKSSNVIPQLVAIREEGRLVRQAKAGDSNAFVQLYDAYGDDVYRYIYFRVLNDVAAEAMTSHVFRYAWDQLETYFERSSTFVQWIYSIARSQVIAYYQASVKSQELQIGCLPAAADYSVSTDASDWTNREAWDGHLRLLAAEKQHGLHQTATLLIMRRSLDHLYPTRKPKPAPTFNAYTRPWLTRYLQYHVRHPKRSLFVERLSAIGVAFSKSFQFRLSLPKLSTLPVRMSLTYAALMAALVFTGTAEAQSALPGDPLYGWKRTSEQAWLSVSPDPIGTSIILADRRLGEWLAVGQDPTRRRIAQDGYLQALSELSSASGPQSDARVAPALEVHKRKLHDSGLATAQLDSYITLAENPPLAMTATQSSATYAVVPATAVFTEVAATWTPTETPTDTPVEVAVTPTPLQVPPTATATLVPTDVPPTVTLVPTEIPATDTPTDTPTNVPTEILPTPTEAPTEVVPTATEIPPQVMGMPAGVPDQVP